MRGGDSERFHRKTKRRHRRHEAWGVTSRLLWFAFAGWSENRFGCRLLTSASTEVVSSILTKVGFVFFLS